MNAKFLLNKSKIHAGISKSYHNIQVLLNYQ